MKAFKVFNPNWICRDFQYEVGKTYTHDGSVELCGSGFHACLRAADCFNYYSFDHENKVAEVEMNGDITHGDDKSVCSEITIVREIKWSELLELVNIGKGNSGFSNSGDRNSGNRNSGNWNSGDRNSGDWNSGDRNSGRCNSGDWNSGDRNSGRCNSGDWNSGNWNSGDRNSGFFNSITHDVILVFNKPCNRIEWEESIKPDFIYFDLTEEIDYSEMQGVCLKTYEYKEAWKKAYDSASKADIKRLKALPNFDADVFEEITGIRVK
jgi:hypothetical protein